MEEAIRTLRRVVAVAWLAIAGVTVACDESPTSSRAVLTSRGALEFSCGLACSYEGDAVNTGAGCAANVRGVTRLLRPNGGELASDSWELPADRRIAIGESFVFEGCCFTIDQVGVMGSSRTELFWDDVPCT